MDTQLSSRSHPVNGPLALPLAPVPLFWEILTISSFRAITGQSMTLVVSLKGYRLSSGMPVLLISIGAVDMNPLGIHMVSLAERTA